MNIFLFLKQRKKISRQPDVWLIHMKSNLNHINVNPAVLNFYLVLLTSDTSVLVSICYCYRTLKIFQIT